MLNKSFEQFVKKEKHDKLLKDIAILIIDYNWTIRQTADNLCIPKSTVHKYIHRDLKVLDIDKYIEVKNILNKHKRKQSI